MARQFALSSKDDPKATHADPAGDASNGAAALFASLPPVTNRQLVPWMFQFLRPVKFYLCLALFYVSLGAGAEVLSVRLTAKVVDTIHRVSTGQIAGGFWGWLAGSKESGGHWQHVGRYVAQAFSTLSIPEATDLPDIIILLAGLMIGLAFVRYVREVNNNKLSMDMVFGIREAVYDKLQRVGFSFHDTLSTGQLINRALSDLQNVRMFIHNSLLTVFEIVLVVSAYVITLAFISPWVAGLSLLPLPLWTLYILRFSRRAQKAQRAVMEAGDANVSIITENIAGVHVIKAFATQQQEVEKYGRNCDRFFSLVLKRIRLFANFQPVIRAIAGASHLTLFLAAGILIIQGKMTPGSILFLGAAMGAILQRLQGVAGINEQYQNAIVSGRRLYEILAIPAAIPQRADALPVPDGPGAVRFEQVTFGYDPAKPVLKDVSFNVPGGSVVAVVGPTGSGKSTLVQLLARFYDPQHGRILLDGVDIRNVSLDSLRTEIAFVFQETYLFSETVSANVAYGRPHIKGGGEVEAAARLAQAHEFVEELPKKYDTILGERGSSLSGGQKQRLAIARAILSNPRVLVLDDATAAIDPETEDLIRRGMRHVMNNRTTFLIAHRVSTVKQADLVVVLEDGRVTQMGTHDELLSQEGHYRTIAAVQLYGSEAELVEAEEKPSHMDRVRDARGVAEAEAAAKERDRSEDRAEAEV